MVAVATVTELRAFNRRLENVMTRQTVTLVLLGSALGTMATARAQTPAVDGEWSTPFSLPLIAIHQAMLPTGKILFFSAEHGVPGIHGWLLDPDTLALTNVAPPAGWNPDCAGHSFLSDGRLLVAGGTLGFNPTRGQNLAYLFDPYTEQWVQIEDMARGRWYPTNITLPDGRVLTMSGLNDTDGALNPDVEIWDPNGTTNWQLVDQYAVPFYPYLHLMPSGNVFRSGPDQQTESFNTQTSTWTPVASTLFPGRFEAPSVLLPPTLDRVMVIGGFTGSGNPTHSAEIIDFSQATPTWQPTSPMTFSRMEFNAVILPDATVLVAGGQSDAGEPGTPVLTPEIYHPISGTWSSVAPHQVPRPYHSTALLLPDGRVCLAGADFQPSGEMYSPAYLFRGPRPTILSAPNAVALAATFGLDFTSSTGNNTVALIRYSSVTHSVNMGQRYVSIAEGVTAGNVNLSAPASGNLAPLGYYMLFVVDDGGVPSVSARVRVITRFGDLDQDNDVDADDATQFDGCFTGFNAGPYSPTCEPADFDNDNDVDCNDWDSFVLAWTEPFSPPSLPQCAAGPTGACCFGNGFCTLQTQVNCEAVPGQVYLGDGTQCVGDMTCPSVCWTCVCTDGTSDSGQSAIGCIAQESACDAFCAGQGGTQTFQCDLGPCAVIPTVSEWGLIVMILAMFVSGTVILGQTASRSRDSRESGEMI
jgi:Galactose oxidase-like, Early set domain/Kelch motif